jgi:hypothetical protein
MVAGVEAHLPAYLLRRTARLLDAWDGATGADRADTAARLRDAVEAATGRVAAELRRLIDTEPAAQHATPLEVVRGAVREPTVVLRAAGMPAVARDEFEERSFPDDRYGLAPRTFADLDDALGPEQLVWGLAKAALLRAPPDPSPL